MVTLSLIGVNTLVYLVSLIFFFQTGGDSDSWIFAHLWLIPAQSYVWTYLTSMFVHAGFFHLFGNMLFLFLFGSCVEDLIGRGKFLGFYLLGGLIAEFTYIAMSPEHFASEIPMGGASGAISSCMGMYLLLRANADIEFKYFLWFLVVRAGEFEIPAWVAITLWFLKDLLGAVLDMFAHERHGGVAFGAHVGGLLAGLAFIGCQKWIGRSPEMAAPEAETTFSELAISRAKALTMNHALNRPLVAVVSETPTIFLHNGQEQTGPFTLTQVQAKLQHGEISREAQYWSDGMTAWENVLELADNPLL